MAYTSKHTGVQIDEAVDKINASEGAWTPKVLTISSWTTNSGGSNEAKYKYEFTASTVVSTDYVAPLIWFVDNSGNRYYADYNVNYSAGIYTIQVYSNTNIAGKLFIFGSALEQPQAS